MTQESVKPFVGMGVSLPRYSDVDAAHIVYISPNEKEIHVTLDTATLLNGSQSGEKDALHFEEGGFCGHVSGKQRWKLEPNPKGHVIKFTLRKNGRWVQVGQPMTGTSQQLSFSHFHYHDFNF